MTLPELDRRLSRAIERQKTIQLSAEELDLFVLSGAYETLSVAAAQELRALIAERRPTATQGEGGDDLDG